MVIPRTGYLWFHEHWEKIKEISICVLYYVLISFHLYFVFTFFFYPATIKKKNTHTQSAHARLLKTRSVTSISLSSEILKKWNVFFKPGNVHDELTDDQESTSRPSALFEAKSTRWLKRSLARVKKRDERSSRGNVCDKRALSVRPCCTNRFHPARILKYPYPRHLK